MNAAIHSVSEHIQSRGKTAKVRTASLAIKARSRRRLPGGEEVRWLEIQASSTRQPGTCERGGEWRAYTNSLTLHLSPTELEEIVKVALANKLIKVPGVEYVLQAKSNLENAIAEMTVGEQGAAERRTQVA